MADDGTDIVAQGDLTQAVREAAMLANVRISMWGAERSDDALMEKVKADAGAQGNVGRVVKNLLAGADGQLRDVHSAFRQVRAIHTQLTLPWVSDATAQRKTGPRLLPTLLWERYVTETGTQRRKALAALETFLADYPDLCARAQANLANMASASEYPSVDDIRAAFAIRFDFEPIPSGQSFKGLPDHVLERLGAALHQKQQRMVAGATHAMWEQARDRVSHIAERLAAGDAKFKNSTVEAVRELVALLPGWNLNDDPRVAELVADIERMLAGVDATALRKDEGLRVSTADKARALADKLATWGLA